MSRTASIALIVVAISSVLVVLLWRFTGNSDVSTNTLAVRTLDSVPIEHLRRLEGKRIFFGHKSVGRNILAGLEEVAAERGLDLDIVETVDPAALESPAFAHMLMGRNEDPASKIDDFTQALDAGLGEKLDIAVFKFCYLDVSSRLEAQEVFDQFSDMADSLTARYPQMAFVPVTIPLRSSPVGFINKLKSFIKTLVQRPTVFDDNAQRYAYNRMLREAYGPRLDVFDLAHIESIDPNGRRHFKRRGGEEIPLMYSGYTYDGGHLNSSGRRHAAEQLLVLLAEVAGKE